MTITRGTLVEYWGSRGMPYGDEATGTRADLKALEEQDAHYLSKYGLTLGDIGKVMRSKSGWVYVTWTLSNGDKATSVPMRSSNIKLLDDDTWIDEVVDNERDKMVVIIEEQNKTIAALNSRLDFTQAIMEIKDRVIADLRATRIDYREFEPQDKEPALLVEVAEMRDAIDSLKKEHVANSQSINKRFDHVWEVVTDHQNELDVIERDDAAELLMNVGTAYLANKRDNNEWVVPEIGSG